MLIYMPVAIAHFEKLLNMRKKDRARTEVRNMVLKQLTLFSLHLKLYVSSYFTFEKNPKQAFDGWRDV